VKQSEENFEFIGACFKDYGLGANEYVGIGLTPEMAETRARQRGLGIRAGKGNWQDLQWRDYFESTDIVGSIRSSLSIIPDTKDIYYLGTTDCAWADVYTTNGGASKSDEK
jgi:hypothetical protein